MKPVLIYDGRCGFCRYWVSRWRTHTGDAIEYAASQDVGDRFPEIPAEAYARSVQFVDETGRVSSGAAAVFQSLTHAKGRGWLWSAYRGVPGFAPVTEFAYAIVARNREIASVFTKILWGSEYEPPRFFLARWLFLRNLGLIFFVAFLSLFLQIDGLIGENGILPASEWNTFVTGRLGADRYSLLPSLYWLHPTDGFLNGLCLVGMVASVCVTRGLFAPVSILVSLACYLSLMNVSQDFLGFQWDILLIETAFLASFLAPVQVLPRWSRERRPAPFVLLLHWWLLFRLLFVSGFVKLGDATWVDLEALNVHYETQPLPTVFAWYAHQLPESIQKTSVVLMFVAELVIPFTILAPRRIRHTGAVFMIAFQLLIALTGNYTFFNWLTIAICLLLFDDQAIAWALRKLRIVVGAPKRAIEAIPRYKWAIGGLAGAILFVLSTTIFAVQLGGRDYVPELLLNRVVDVQPYRIMNTYGLFARMTTTRPEIVVEGSDDGVEWKAYRFRWKPGDLDGRPRLVAPFQPRLDWQMWFAALGSAQSTPWFTNFIVRLFQDSDDVTALLAENPFREKPPKYIRALLYEYRFTNFAERRETGNWWKRELLGEYLPIVELPPEMTGDRTDPTDRSDRT